MKRLSTSLSSGASIIELLLVMAIIGIFARLITLNLFRGQQRTSLTVARDMFISDARRTQLQAMQGETESPGSYLDYSIRFEQDRYIIFPGTVYDAGNAANQVVALDPMLRFTAIELPFSTVTFSRLSGDIRNFDAAQNSVTLSNTQTGDSYRLRFNERGVLFMQ